MAPLLLLLLFCLSTATSASAANAFDKSNFLPEPVPTQFEVAMIDTWKFVKEGKIPDPSTRKADGTPGTLLDALLPEPPNEEAIESHRRKLQKAAKWRFFGANIPFLAGPTLAALNASFYRYSSVPTNGSVDWRTTAYITPIQAQYDCSSCWLMAAADSVAMMYGIATKTPSIAAGIQQVCDSNADVSQNCGELTCCQGGWPEDAFAWMVNRGNITAASSYIYRATDGRNCTLTDNYTVAGKVTGWERVPIHSSEDLKRAVHMQPVLVYISAFAKDFVSYRSTAPGTPGFNIYDGNCTTEVNHAVLVVGYSTTGPVNYWILKNTWMADAWGDRGYMYIRMLEGPGKCGMLSVNPLFPVYFPNAPPDVTVDGNDASPTTTSSTPYFQTNWTPSGDPCSGIVNPCGGGQCYVQGGMARCRCPLQSGNVAFGELAATPTSKCVSLFPCTNSLTNPCGAGTCMNVGDGSYVCGCPSGYTVGTRTNGAPTCIPVSAVGVRPKQYVTQYKDTCLAIAAAFNVTTSQFIQLNPYVKCGGDMKRRLPQGLVINLPASSTALCTQQYAIRTMEGHNDTCTILAYYLDYKKSDLLKLLVPPDSNPSQTLIYGTNKLDYTGTYSNFNSLMALNPTLNCSTLLSSQTICVDGTTSGFSAVPVTCGQSYTTVQGDSCSNLQSQFKLNSTQFKLLNPGINCNFNMGIFSAGVQLCVSSITPMNITCTQWYTVQQGDTCAQIWNAANISQFQLLYINPGLQCQPPHLFVGRQLCIDSPSLDTIADPSFPTYIVRPGDTWGTIQAQFSSKCKTSSILVEAIATQNGIGNWSKANLSTGLSLVIPCVPKIGAECGCAPSLYVCGANFITYMSYCDARCNFATPVFNSQTACDTCRDACAGRYGMLPSPTSDCPAGYVCPQPQWPPPDSDASAVFATSPRCNFRMQTCDRACATFNERNNLPATDSTCYNKCMACHQVPCQGPSVTTPVGSSVCPSCGSTGCSSYLKSTTTCAINCAAWNTLIWPQSNTALMT